MKSENTAKWEYCFMAFSFLCLVVFTAFVAYLVAQSKNHECKENINVERPIGISTPFNDRLLICNYPGTRDSNFDSKYGCNREVLSIVLKLNTVKEQKLRGGNHDRWRVYGYGTKNNRGL